MFSSRSNKANSAVRLLSVFYLALCVSNSAILRAQTNNSSGLLRGRTTGGANQGSSTSSGLSGSHTNGSPSLGTNSNFGTGAGGTSIGNSQNSAQSGSPPIYGSGAIRAARMRATSAAANTAQHGQGSYVGAGPAFGANSLPSQPNSVTSLGGGMFGGQAISRSSSAAQTAGQSGIQVGLSNGYVTSTGPAAATTRTVGFESAAAPPSEVESAIARHLQGMPALHFLTPLRVELDGRTAILRGSPRGGGRRRSEHAHSCRPCRGEAAITHFA